MRARKLTTCAKLGLWGNPKLVTWDYNKEITLTLEDALISMESLRFMLGGAIKQENTGSPVEIARTEEGIIAEENTPPTLTDHITGETLTLPATGCRYLNMTTGTRGTMTNATTGLTAAEGDRVRFFWTEEKQEAEGIAVEITISPNTFPGAYRVVGDTFIRDTNNDDHAFQFIINKAKVSSNVTITLEAEGDPSTFEMTLTVLRDESGNMMKLVSYD